MYNKSTEGVNRRISLMLLFFSSGIRICLKYEHDINTLLCFFFFGSDIEGKKYIKL